MQVYDNIKALIKKAVAAIPNPTLQKVLEAGFFAESVPQDSFVRINPLSVDDPIFDVQLKRISQLREHYFYMSPQIFDSYIQDDIGEVHFKQQPFEDTFFINLNKYLTVRENKLTLKVPQHANYGAEFILKEPDNLTANDIFIIPLKVGGYKADNDGDVKIPVVTHANLPVNPYNGQRAYCSDSNIPPYGNYGFPFVGGGGYFVSCFYDEHVTMDWIIG